MVKFPLGDAEAFWCKATRMSEYWLTSSFNVVGNTMLHWPIDQEHMPVSLQETQITV